MLRSAFFLVIGVAFFAAGEPARAETCTGYYQKCSQFCAANSGKLTRCLKECTTLRRQCMKTGKWVGRGGKDNNVEKR